MHALPLLLCTALAVSGCSTYLPASGPTAGAIAEGAEVATAQGVFARYEIIDVNAGV
ncbi:sugar transporter, partial [Methylobacterium iners]